MFKKCLICQKGQPYTYFFNNYDLFCYKCIWKVELVFMFLAFLVLLSVIYSLTGFIK